MRINQAGLDLIKSFEGCRLTVYRDIKNLKTVGWGHRCEDLSDGDTITQEQADEYLRDDLVKFENDVSSMVKLPLNENQFSALVSFVYNAGPESLRTSLLLKCINSHNLPDAARQFERWDHSGGIVVPGLLRRRLAEKALFLS